MSQTNYDLQNTKFITTSLIFAKLLKAYSLVANDNLVQELINRTISTQYV